MGWFGNRAILAAIAAVAVLNIATTAAMLGRPASRHPEPAEPSRDGRPMSRAGVAVIVAAFVALQASNSAVVSIMSLFVTDRLGLAVTWAGAAVGVAAGLEIPALLLIGKLNRRFTSLRLIASGCLAGITCYTAMAFVSGPLLLIGLQVLNAWFFAVVAGVGLSLFQRLIPRPGLASGIYTNTRRVGSIVSGPIIGFGSMTVPGYSGVFAVCAALTVLALAAVGVASRAPATDVAAVPVP